RRRPRDDARGRLARGAAGRTVVALASAASVGGAGWNARACPEPGAQRDGALPPSLRAAPSRRPGPFVPYNQVRNFEAMTTLELPHRLYPAEGRELTVDDWYALGAPTGVKLAGDIAFEPDILYLTESRLDRLTERGVDGAPDLVV